MAGASTTFVTARLLLPDYIVQGMDTVISCPLYQDGEIVAVSSGTVSVYDASNTAQVSGASVTVDGDGVATYTVLGTLTSSLTRGMGWRVEWSLVRDGVTTMYRNSAGLVRSLLTPVVTDEDLYRRESGLNPNGRAPLSTLTTYQPYLDEAWVTIMGRLAAAGNVPHLIVEPATLREPHLYLTLSLIFEDFRTRLNEAHTEKAKGYEERWDKAWDRLSFEYATADSGQSDGRRKRSANPTLWLGGFDR